MRGHLSQTRCELNLTLHLYVETKTPTKHA